MIWNLRFIVRAQGLQKHVHVHVHVVQFRVRVGCDGIATFNSI